jgi:GNAT superfamily N-acetyltransferase
MMDVFVLEEYRGKGLGKWLVESVLDYPTFEPVRRWLLATEDAHELYRRYGFGPYKPISDLMMKFDPEKYKTD